MFKDIINYEGLYRINTKGDTIVNIKTGRIKKFYHYKPGTNREHIAVSLYKEGRKKRLLVHRLVAMTFIPNTQPELKTQVNHIDGNRINNGMNNLEWVTPSENVIHAYKVLKRKGTGYGKLNEQANNKVSVFMYDQGVYVKYWPCLIMAARELGFSIKSISKVLRGKRKKLYNRYTFFYTKQH